MYFVVIFSNYLFCPGCYHFFKSLKSDAEKAKFDDLEAGPSFGRAGVVRFTFDYTLNNALITAVKQLIATVMRLQSREGCPEDALKLFQRLKHKPDITPKTVTLYGDLDKERLPAKKH